MLFVHIFQALNALEHFPRDCELLLYGVIMLKEMIMPSYVAGSGILLYFDNLQSAWIASACGLMWLQSLGTTSGDCLCNTYVFGARIVIIN
jgi:hypothetical protein